MHLDLVQNIYSYLVENGIIMPLEIRELTIKVNVDPPSSQMPVDYEKKLETLKTQVIEECMRKISFLLESYGER